MKILCPVASNLLIDYVWRAMQMSACLFCGKSILKLMLA